MPGMFFKANKKISKKIKKEQGMSQFLLKNGNEVILPSIVGPEYDNRWMPEGFTNVEHHASIESTSSSSLKDMTISPWTYLSELKDRQNGQGKKETKTMKFGTLCHLIILEPGEFKKRFIMSPKFDMRTTKGKEGKAIFDLECPEGAVILNDEEYENLLGVVDAILDHQEAKNIFSEGVSERSGFYRDPVTGILCRIRPDWISTADGLSMFIDFKTAKNSSYRGFQKQIWELRYDIQLVMYREGIKQITGNYPEISGWVVVENKKPFEVAIYPFDKDSLDTANAWYRYCLDKLAKCIKEKKFPQRQISNENMILPSYATMTEIPML